MRARPFGAHNGRPGPVLEPLGFPACCCASACPSRLRAGPAGARPLLPLALPQEFGAGLGPRLPQMLVLLGSPLHTPRLAAVGSAPDPFLPYLREQERALPHPLRSGCLSQLAAHGIEALLGGRKAHLPGMHLLEQRRLAGGLADQVVA